MTLTPDIKVPELYKGAIKPSKTYEFDFETGEVKGKIDGQEAIEQFIRKAIKTARYRQPIYSPLYGSELEDLIGQGFTGPLMKAEIMRVTTEAIIYDERINRVSDFTIEVQGDKVNISFKVDSVEGAFAISEVI